MLEKLSNFLKKSHSQKIEALCSTYVFQRSYTYKSELLFDECLQAPDFDEYVENLVSFEFRRRYGLGKIHQLGLVVQDVEKAVPTLEKLGMGPFAIVENDCKFWFESSGRKSVRIKSAIGYYRSVEIEPLGPVDGSNIYKQSLDSQGRLVLHHVAFSVSNVDEWTSRFITEGFPLVMRGRVSIGPLNIDFSYMDTSEELGLLLEFCSYSIFGRTFKPPPATFHLMGRLEKLSGIRSISLAFFSKFHRQE